MYFGSVSAFSVKRTFLIRASCTENSPSLIASHTCWAHFVQHCTVVQGWQCNAALLFPASYFPPPYQPLPPQTSLLPSPPFPSPNSPWIAPCPQNSMPHFPLNPLSPSQLLLPFQIFPFRPPLPPRSPPSPQVSDSPGCVGAGGRGCHHGRDGGGEGRHGAPPET